MLDFFRSCKVLPLRSNQDIKKIIGLTGDKRQSCELFIPVFGHFDGFLLLFFSIDGVPLLVGVLNQLLGIIMLESVENVPKILSVHGSAFGEPIWEELHEVLVIFHQGEQMFDTELIEIRGIDKLDVFDGEEGFLLE